jgi:hypothetical protein
LRLCGVCWTVLWWLGGGEMFVIWGVWVVVVEELVGCFLVVLVCGASWWFHGGDGARGGFWC